MRSGWLSVSVLFNEPKLLKSPPPLRFQNATRAVSVLFNEPKLLKLRASPRLPHTAQGFSALQRAEIAEIHHAQSTHYLRIRFSALQRAEIAEMALAEGTWIGSIGFSALQRAEIAEIIFFRLSQPRANGFQCSSTSRNC